MTLKDLQRLVQPQQGRGQSRALGMKLERKPFWYCTGILPDTKKKANHVVIHIQLLHQKCFLES